MQNDAVKRLVVVGGNAGGMTAASAARRRRGPDELDIIAFEAGSVVSYSSCGIPYWIGGLVAGEQHLIARSVQKHRNEHAIDVRVRHRVERIDLERRELVARNLDDDAELWVPFDQLMYATGAVPIRPEWAEGVDGVFGVQTLADGEAIRRWLDTDPRPRRAVVVGGGYIGVEMAESMVRLGMAVTLIERERAPMSTMDPELGAMVADAMTGLGILIRDGESVRGLDTTNGRVTAVVTDRESVPAEIVILGLGVRPNTALAVQAGMPLGQSGGLITDEHMAVPGHDAVWAAGDCVETRHRITGKGVHVPLGTHANKQGRVAGITIAGGTASFPGVIGTAVTKVCDIEVGRTGLGEVEARQAGFDAISATIRSTNRAGYLPDAETITVKLVAERGSGRVLGGQVVGRSEAAKRIDVIAAAVWNGMHADDIAMLDLGYAPPYSPVWDPVLVAARKLVDSG